MGYKTTSESGRVTRQNPQKEMVKHEHEMLTKSSRECPMVGEERRIFLFEKIHAICVYTTQNPAIKGHSKSFIYDEKKHLKTLSESWDGWKLFFFSGRRRSARALKLICICFMLFVISLTLLSLLFALALKPAFGVVGLIVATHFDNH